MTQTTATQQAKGKSSDKTAIRPFSPVSVPEAELTESHRRINAAEFRLRNDRIADAPARS